MKKRLAVYGHCTIDCITISGQTHAQIGGSACYCAAMARQFGFEAHMITRFGPDFPMQYLDDSGISYSESSYVPDSGTTRFSLDVRGAERTLRLEHACDKITYEPPGSGADCTIASPLFGELSEQALASIIQDKNFLLVDPQGFLRGTAGDGTVVLRDTGVDLGGSDAIKASADEALHLTGESGDGAMLALQRRGIEHVLYVDGADISLLNGDKIYSISLPNKVIHDTTGLGDIFCAAFCCTMIRERDFLWALCFAGGAAQAALDTKLVGLGKIPKKSAVQVNASYFYNTIKFRTV